MKLILKNLFLSLPLIASQASRLSYADIEQISESCVSQSDQAITDKCKISQRRKFGYLCLKTRIAALEEEGCRAAVESVFARKEGKGNIKEGKGKNKKEGKGKGKSEKKDNDWFISDDSYYYPEDDTIQTPCQITPIQLDDAPVDDADELVGLIITFSQGSSYDDIYMKVPQRGGPGERVAVYQATVECIMPFNMLLRTGDVNGYIFPYFVVPFEQRDRLLQIQQEMTTLASTPSAIIFNFECSSGWSADGFGKHDKDHDLSRFNIDFFSSPVIPLPMLNSVNSDEKLTSLAPPPHRHEKAQSNVLVLIKAAIDVGFMVICSDFSLKALIADWDDHLLGPNPFQQVGSVDSSIDLAFDPIALIKSPSGQLQKVGELSQGGKANIHALGGTIAYSVDMAVVEETNAYTLEVLTVAEMPSSSYLDVPDNLILEAGNSTGTAGHVLVTYPSGGMLLTSAGHWIELVRLDVSYESVLEVAQLTYGSAYAGEFMSEYWGLESTAQSQLLQQYAADLVAMNGFQSSRGVVDGDAEGDADGGADGETDGVVLVGTDGDVNGDVDGEADGVVDGVAAGDVDDVPTKNQ